MSVGKDSILRAANAEAKNTEAKTAPVKPAEEAKAPAEAKEAPKAETKEPAAKKTPARKTRTTKTKDHNSQKSSTKENHNPQESRKDFRSHTREFRRTSGSFHQGQSSGRSTGFRSGKRRTPGISPVIVTVHSVGFTHIDLY